MPDLYRGFSEKQAEYEDWLFECYGEPMRRTIGQAPKLVEKQSKAAMAELRDIEQSLPAAMEKGVVPEARELDILVERHHRWVSRMWPQPCTMDAYSGLADIYDHPDFARRYETIAPCFARWLPMAMRPWHGGKPSERKGAGPFGLAPLDCCEFLSVLRTVLRSGRVR
ncbi:TipAS antibiotic-recognition protein [Aminobacter aminovorans]|uniref:TipAS antibiotic-recognition domain n=1 Tax=Aminobacter aminovorans TaxID=83263 RepID=A0A380WKZ4_AMIAI|nr:TipAS antibiotic-recognition domain-containing protein [Aminobacter aminovorans]TCS28971.1 TipAS antibiotic-recognition protein [Aminobacter aminovorans]SUU88824.1 TipAS antibiotic-recognition domain [Aminobacter aminovorans]